MVSPLVHAKTLDSVLTPAEREAVEQFRARLHEILRDGQLRSLILYGSKARGDTHPFSDIDLLVVHDAITPEQQEQLRGAVVEFELEHGLEHDFEIITQSYANIAPMEVYGEPLMQNIQRDGIVFEGEPIMVKKIDKPRLIQTALAAARTDLADAELMLERGSPKGVISKCYYVLLDAARAALLAKDLTPQSHAGTQTMFSLHFVKPKLVDAKWSALFSYMEKNRLYADYEPEKEFTREDAQVTVARAREFLALIENLMPTLLAADEAAPE